MTRPETTDLLDIVGKEMRREERQARLATANRVRLGIGRLLGSRDGIPLFVRL